MALISKDNLKGFAYQRPPLIIFLVCLLLFAIALISLGIYVQHHQVEKYEDKDWNDFFQDFSQQQFCIPLDMPGLQTTETTSLSSFASTTQQTEMAKGFNVEDFVSAESVCFAVSLELHPTENQKLQNLAGLTSLSSAVPAGYINLNKRVGIINMTFHLTQPLEVCEKNNCPTSNVSACLTLGVLREDLPQIGPSVHPKACNKSVSHGLSIAPVMQARLKNDTDEFCTEGLLVNTAYMYNPKLTHYLSEEEKSIINLHLMYTSYFLFLMLITSVFYAMVKGPPMKSFRVVNKNGNHKKPSLPV